MIEKGIKGFLLKNVIIYKVKITDDTISFGVYHTVTCDVKSFLSLVFINFNISLHSIILMSHFFAFFMIDDEPVHF